MFILKIIGIVVVIVSLIYFFTKDDDDFDLPSSFMGFGD